MKFVVVFVVGLFFPPNLHHQEVWPKHPHLQALFENNSHEHNGTPQTSLQDIFNITLLLCFPLMKVTLLFSVLQKKSFISDIALIS